DVLLRERLEDVLVPHPASGIAGARLARPEDGEVDAGRPQQLRRRLRGGPGTLVEGRGAADPVEHLGRRVARLEDADAEAVRPPCPLDLGLAPRVAAALDVAEHRAGLGREARVDHDALPAQADDGVDLRALDRALVAAGAA